MKTQGIQPANQEIGATQTALGKFNNGTYGRIRTTTSSKSTKLPTVVRREVGYFDAIRTILDSKKYTFLFDINETIITQDSEYPSNEVKRTSLSDGTAVTTAEYLFKHTYPTSLGHVELFNILKELEQNVGFVTRASTETFLRLKMSGISLDDIDFISIIDPLALVHDLPIEMYREYFEIEDQVKSLKELLKAIEEKHGIKIDTYHIDGDKRYAQSQLYKNGNEKIRTMLEIPIISIGDGIVDPYLAYPYHDLEQVSNESEHDYEPNKGGIGIQLLSKYPRDSSSTVVYSLGRAVYYASSLVTGDIRGKEHVKEVENKCKITKKPLIKRDELVGEVHGITTHPNMRDINRTWELLLKQGPILQ